MSGRECKRREESERLIPRVGWESRTILQDAGVIFMTNGT